MEEKGCILKLFKGCLVTIGLLLVLILAVYAYFEWKEYYASSSLRVERITGVKVPAYKIVEYNKGRRGFNGDYNDSYVIEFESMPSDDLFDEIDKKIAEDRMKQEDYRCIGWTKNDNVYSFSAMWGNGIPAPEGESEGDDGTFSISITRGSKIGEMHSGAW